MRQILCSIAVVTLVTVAGETATAAVRISVPAHPHPVAHAVVHHPVAAGVAAAVVRHPVYHPTTYVGWTHYCWNATYRCYNYYCPTTRTWFYYSQSQTCYLPVTSIVSYPPTPEINVVVNTSATLPPGTPALPPGATALPIGFKPPAR